MSRIKARSLRELLDEKFTLPPFIVFPLLPRGGKLFIYGPKKHYKSMLLDNCIYDLAEGVPFLGQWQVETQYSCLLVEQEVGPFMTRKRFDKIHTYRGGQSAMDNIIIVSKERKIKLDTPDGYSYLAELIEEYKPQVVALDPIRKFHRQDENDSTAITNVVDNMDRLIEQYKVTLILAHHQGHESQFGNRHMRGSSVWGDEADTIINLSKPIKTGEYKDKVIRVEVEDIRHAASPPYFDLQFDEDTHTFTRR